MPYLPYLPYLPLLPYLEEVIRDRSYDTDSSQAKIEASDLVGESDASKDDFFPVNWDNATQRFLLIEMD